MALQDMAASGTAPVVLQDCLRWLALRGLTTQRLFQTPVGGDKRKLLALRHLYDTGRRPLRSKSCRDKDPHLVRNAHEPPFAAGQSLLWHGLRSPVVHSSCRIVCLFADCKPAFVVAGLPSQAHFPSSPGASTGGEPAERFL